MAKLKFHPSARIELVEAIAYHERQRPGYGAKFESELDSVVERIVQLPQSGASLAGYPQELNIQAFHLATFRYSLIVANTAGEQTVYAVAHQRKRPGYWKTRFK